MLVFIGMLEKTQQAAQYRAFAGRLKTYLATTLHSDVRFEKWNGSGRLPAYLSRRYGYYAGTFGGLESLFAIDLSADEATPSDLGKHLASLARAFDGPIVYAADRLNATRRSRLVAARIPFVVPGNQLYLPQLAIDLREHFRNRPARSAELLSPIAQALLFYGILFRNEPKVDRSNRNPSRLATGLGYSAMSVGRAFDELAAAGLVTVEKRGRSKTIDFNPDGKAVIEQARPLLRNPVRSRKFIRSPLKILPMKIAGEAALSNLTGLSSPRLPTYAIHADDWTEVSSANDIINVGDLQEAGCVMELWYYDPGVLSEYATVDPLSLYAQFWDDPNERVAEAANQALEHVPW